VTVLGRYAARFSVRALGVTVDASLLWVGAGLAMAAAVALAYVPRLPGPHAPTGPGLAAGGARITPGTNRRLRAFAVTQIALSFMLLAGAVTLLAALVALQTANTGYNLRQVLALDVPLPVEAAGPKAIGLFEEATRPRTAKRTRTGGCESSAPVSSRRSASPCWPAATSARRIGAAASWW
jgi:hypothetical protein